MICEVRWEQPWEMSTLESVQINVENMLVFIVCSVPFMRCVCDKNTAPSYHASRVSNFLMPWHIGSWFVFLDTLFDWQGKSCNASLTATVLTMLFQWHSMEMFQTVRSTTTVNMYSSRIYQCKNWNDPVILAIYSTKWKTVDVLRFVKGKFFGVKWATQAYSPSMALRIAISFVLFSFPTFT